MLHIKCMIYLQSLSNLDRRGDTKTSSLAKRAKPVRKHHKRHQLVKSLIHSRKYNRKEMEKGASENEKRDWNYVPPSKVTMATTAVPSNQTKGKKLTSHRLYYFSNITKSTIMSCDVQVVKCNPHIARDTNYISKN